MEYRFLLAGWLLFTSILAALASGFFHLSPLPAGLLQLAVAALLFGRVSSLVRLQCLFLVVGGGLALFLAKADGATLLAALSTNQAMIAMLAAVGFLRLVPLAVNAGPLPTGQLALWQTLFGIHWLGSVNNLSAMVLFGDRMAGNPSRLNRTQTLVLSRGFALAALWSPFFVAMGISLTQAPGARLLPVILWGLPLSHLLLALLAWHLGRTGKDGVLDFNGYPFNLTTMGGPLLLAMSVLSAHLLAPRLSIVSLVTLAVPIYAFIACRKRGPLSRAAEFIRRDLPSMGPEVLLFFAAGVLGTGITALVNHSNLTLPFIGSGALAAALGLGVILLMAAIGIHPIVGITAVASILSHIVIRPDLLALSFLMGWGLGVSICPISGINLLLAGRYQIPLGRVWSWHGGFVFCAYLICCIWLFIIDHFA